MDNNNQWQQQPYNGIQQPYNGMQQNYGAYPQVNDKKGLSITALILGILSVTICCCFGWLTGLAGVIFAIIALVKEPKGKVMATIGLVLSSLGLLLSIVFTALCGEDFTEAFKEGFEYGYEQGSDAGNEVGNIIMEELAQSIEESGGDASDLYSEEHFWGSKYTANDDSIIYFYEDGTFDWFLTDLDYDNVKSGTYEVMFGYDAKDWLVTDHPEYGITQEELTDYWDRNSDSDLYRRENLTILTLTTEVAKMDGEQQNDEPYTVDYYGYSNEVGFDGVNLKTFNYMTLYTEY